MKKKIFLMLIGLLILQLHVFSQSNLGEYKDPKPKKINPEIGGLGVSNGDALVDLYTGKLNVNIPLYVIETKDLKLPISLSYNRDGIKVQEKASWVGLGFNLNHVSYIHRERKGMPDESGSGRFQVLGFSFPPETGNNQNDMIKKIVNRPYVYNPTFYSGTYGSLWADYEAFSFLLRGRSEWVPYDISVDSEPDIFTFSFLGEAGRFILDEYGEPLIIEGDSKIKISPAIGPKGSDSWIVKLPNGTQLKFPNSLEFLEKEEYTYLKDVTASTHSKIYATYGQYTYLWWVSEITSLADQKISFEYQATPDVIDVINQTRTLRGHVYTMKEYEPRSGSPEQGWTNPRTPLKTTTYPSNYNDPNNFFLLNSPPYLYEEYSKVISPKYVSKITFPSGKVIFKSSNIVRKDAPLSPCLQEIQVLNNKDEIITKIVPEYNYFMSNGINDPDPLNFRLQLVGIVETDGNGTNKEHLFEYNTNFNLPNRNSVQQDYFGYYNNNQSNTLLPTFTLQGKLYTFGDRLFDENRMQANMLKKIFYPTGGYSEFFYKQNSLEVILGSPFPIGGLRVEEVKDFDGKDVRITKYKYQNGATPMILYNPSLHFFTKEIVVDQYLSNNNSKLNVDERTVLLMANYPMYPFYLTKGGYVGYGKVEVIKQGIGKSIYKFTSPADHPDLLSQRIVSPLNNLLLNITPPDFTHISKDEERGLLLSKKVYNEDGILIQEDVNKYNFNFKNDVIKVWGLVSKNIQRHALIEEILENTVTIGDLYYHESSNLILEETERIIFTNQGNLSERTFYSYNENKQVKEVTQFHSSGSVSKKSFRYISDVTPNQVSFTFIHRLMNNANLLQPLEVTTLNLKGGQEYVTEVGLTKFDKLFNPLENKYLVVPSAQFNFRPNVPLLRSDFTPYTIYFDDNEAEDIESIDLSMELEKNFRYDLIGNLISIREFGINSTSYIWGYDSQYVTADAKNAVANEIYYEGFEEPSLSEWGINIYPTGSYGWPLVFDSSKKRSGEYSGRVDNTNSGWEAVSHSNKWLDISLTAPKRFHYSGWVYSDGPGTKMYLFMKRAGETGYYSYIDNVSTVQTGKWIYLEKDFLVPADVTGLSLRVDVGSLGSAYFDDLRICPSDAQMTTYTYKPLVGMTSMTDASGRTTYYEYDGFKRLKNLKDQEGNIIKTNEYHYKNQ